MYKEKLSAYFDQHKQDILNDIMTICRIRSVREPAKPDMPYGEGPANALKKTLELAKGMNLSVKNYDNYVMTADFNDKETQLGILAHLDVVHEGKGWTVCEPYEPVVKGDRIYGRGTADDKGPAIVALWALKAIKDLGIELNKNVRVILGTDEECGSSDLRYYKTKESFPPMSFSPDSSYPVTNIEKGGLNSTFDAKWEENGALPRVISINGGTAGNIVPQECTALVEGISLEDAKKYLDVPNVKFTAAQEGEYVRIDAYGESAHASTPHLGINSITATIKAICSMPMAKSDGFDKLCALNKLIPHGDYLGEALGVKQADDISGHLTLNFGIFEYTLTGLSGKIDSRTPICANENNMSKIVYAKLFENGITLAKTEMNPPHHTPSESPFVKTLNAVYEEYTGNEGGCVAIGGGTYVHHIDGGVAFGCSMPGTQNNMHGPDESAVIDELIVSGKIFADIILKICG